MHGGESTTDEIEQLRRDDAHRGAGAGAVAGAGAAAVATPPASFELQARMRRAHLANTLCSGNGQLYVHTAAQVPTQYYVCAKALFEFSYSLRHIVVVDAAQARSMRLRLLLWAEREQRYVYVLAETSLPLRDTRAGSFSFYVPPVVVTASFFAFFFFCFFFFFFFSKIISNCLTMSLFKNPRKYLSGTHWHLPQFKFQLFVTVGAWTGFIGDVWTGSLRSTRAASAATELSTESKNIGQALRGRAPPPFLTDNDDAFLKAAFGGSCTVQLAPDSVLLRSYAIDDVETERGATVTARVVSPSASAPIVVNSSATTTTTTTTAAAAAAVVATSPRATRRKRGISVSPANDKVAPVAPATATASTPVEPSAKRAHVSVADGSRSLSLPPLVPPLVPPPPPQPATHLRTRSKEPSSDNDSANNTRGQPFFGSSPDKMMAALDAMLMPPPPPVPVRDEFTMFFSSPSPRSRSRSASSQAAWSQSQSSSAQSTSSMPFGSPLGRTRSATRRLSLTMPLISSGSGSGASGASTAAFDDFSRDLNSMAGGVDDWGMFSET